MTKPAYALEIKLVAVFFGGCFLIGPAAAQTLDSRPPSGRLEPRRDSQIERTALPPMAPKKQAPEDLPEPEREAENVPAGSATIHLASYFTKSDAMTGWELLSTRYPGELSDHEPILREVDLGARGRFVRLLAGPLKTAGDADGLCRRLERAGAYCAPADITGDLMALNKDWD